MKKSSSFKIIFSLVGTAVLASCTLNVSSSSEGSSFSLDASSSNEEIENNSESSTTIEESTIEDSSSKTEEISSESSRRDEIDVLEYEDVVNTVDPDQNKTYRIAPTKVNGDEFTVYNVKYDTKGYLAHPTTLTIKKSDYCLTYETVALYYQAFRQVPPNYVTSKSATGDDDYRLVSTYTYGSYSGKNSYTESLGEFNNTNGGKYLELDIKLNSYSLKNRGAGRVVIVVDGIEDYGNEPVCYFTNDHYYTFWEFYNYATGWGPSFRGIGSSSSERDIPLTISPIY